VPQLYVYWATEASCSVDEKQHTYSLFTRLQGLCQTAVILAEWWDAGVVMCLGQGADLYMAQLMPLTLTVSCSSKSRLVLPFWFYLSGAGSPG